MIQQLLDPSAEKALSLDVDRLSPTWLSMMKEYQFEGVRFIVRRGGRGLIGDEMGRCLCIAQVLIATMEDDHS